MGAATYVAIESVRTPRLLSKGVPEAHADPEHISARGEREGGEASGNKTSRRKEPKHLSLKGAESKLHRLSIR